VKRFLERVRAAGVQVIYVKAVYNSATNQYISDVWREQGLRRRRSR
jgi:hypothetical protein